MNEVQKLYKHISNKEKERLVKICELDKERYINQMKELQSKGFFTLKDGTKSSDKINKNYSNYRNKRV